MRGDLEKILVEECPNLYKDIYGPPMNTCMAWGIECGDGWFDLLRNLSHKLESLILKLPEDQKQVCCASQVKEKYGTLRFYMNGSTDEMEKLIQEAEGESEETCEECGIVGKLRGKGWVTTLCNFHAEQRGYYIDDLEPDLL